MPGQPAWGIVGQVARLSTPKRSGRSRSAAVRRPSAGVRSRGPSAVLRRTGIAARLHGMGIAPRHGRDAQTELRAQGTSFRVDKQD